MATGVKRNYGQIACWLGDEPVRYAQVYGFAPVGERVRGFLEFLEEVNRGGAG